MSHLLQLNHAWFFSWIYLMCFVLFSLLDNVLSHTWHLYRLVTFALVVLGFDLSIWFPHSSILVLGWRLKIFFFSWNPWSWTFLCFASNENIFSTLYYKCCREIYLQLSHHFGLYMMSTLDLSPIDETRLTLYKKIRTIRFWYL